MVKSRRRSQIPYKITVEKYGKGIYSSKIVRKNIYFTDRDIHRPLKLQLQHLQRFRSVEKERILQNF